AGGHLARVGEVLVVGQRLVVADLEHRDLRCQPGALVLELAAQGGELRLAGHHPKSIETGRCAVGCSGSPPPWWLSRGSAARYDANMRSTDTLVYTCVVLTLAWPSISCTARRSAPWSSMWVAHECRSTWGVSLSAMPASLPRGL